MEERDRERTIQRARNSAGKTLPSGNHEESKINEKRALEMALQDGHLLPSLTACVCLISAPFDERRESVLRLCGPPPHVLPIYGANGHELGLLCTETFFPRRD